MLKMDEHEFRSEVESCFQKIFDAFEPIDPDVAEAEKSLGSLIITLADQSRVILSVQPSVRQVWLAIAAQGRAHHFNFEPLSRSWQEDRAPHKCLYPVLEEAINGATGLLVHF